MAMMVLGMVRRPPQYTPPALSIASDPKARRTFGISTNPFPIVAQLSKLTYLKNNGKRKRLRNH